MRAGLYQKKIRPRGLLTHEVYYNTYRHISKVYLAYASRLGLEIKPELSAPVLPSLRQELEVGIRTRFQLEEGRELVVVNVNAGELFAFRKWPAQHFAELLAGLSGNHANHYYLLIGQASQIGYISRILEQIGPRKNVLNCAGRTSLRELFALIEMSSLVITNDSGPLHIASCYEKNIVAFYGPETPVVYGPLNGNSLVFYSSSLYCSPCLSVFDNKRSLYHETCKRNECLLAIRPEQVRKEIAKRFPNHA